MSRQPVNVKTMPGIGYRHTRIMLDEFQPTSHWLVISEDLGRNHQVGDTMIYVPDRKNATAGLVEAVGPEASAAGIKVGDKVLYEEWKGGRWAFTIPSTSPLQTFEELECLIISLDAIWAIL